MTWRRLAALAACVCGISAPPAGATSLTFEDIPGGSVQNSFGVMPEYYGFNISPNMNWRDVVGSLFNRGAHSGDFALLNAEGGTGVITAADGGDFTFEGLWAKWWPTGPESGGADSLFGTLSGNSSGLQVWSVATSLNGSYEFYGPQAGAIDELRLGMGNYFLVDDIELGEATAVVPEPASMMLVGIGLAGVAAPRRVRRRD